MLIAPIPFITTGRWKPSIDREIENKRRKCRSISSAAGQNLLDPSRSCAEECYCRYEETCSRQGWGEEDGFGHSHECFKGMLHIKPRVGNLANRYTQEEEEETKTVICEFCTALYDIGTNDILAKPEARQPLAARNHTNIQQTRPIAPVPRHAKVNIYANAEPSPMEDSDVESEEEESEMDLDEHKHLDTGLTPSLGGMGVGMEDGSSIGEMTEDEEDGEEAEDDNWLKLSEEETERARLELELVRSTFHDDVDMFDTTMVAEYAEDIFAHMGKLEVCTGMFCLKSNISRNP